MSQFCFIIIYIHGSFVLYICNDPIIDWGPHNDELEKKWWDKWTGGKGISYESANEGKKEEWETAPNQFKVEGLCVIGWYMRVNSGRGKGVECVMKTIASSFDIK